MNQAFEILISQGFEINVYLPIKTVTLEDSVDNKWLFELKKKNPNNFFIHNSLPIKRLIKEISKYDFGINLTVINRSNLICQILLLMVVWELRYILFWKLDYQF